MPERLHAYLARRGVASRRAAERLISAGRVRVNGEVVDALGTKVDAERDCVELDGRAVLAAEMTRSIVLNKPRGVVCTVSDPQGRPTVVDLVPRDRRVYPVGRLDYDSEGLIVLTNDGELAFFLTHPRHAVEKEYRALVRGHLDGALLDRLRDGVLLDGSRTTPADVDVIGREGPLWWLRVIVHEGRNRQIRRMADAVGLEVVRLVRIRVGGLELGDLRPGAWRQLGLAELARLRSATP